MIDFLTHPHHRYTQSFDWIHEAIGLPVRTLSGTPETLREYLPSLKTNPPRLLILFQLEHLAAWASYCCPVLVFPMNDLTRLTPDAYLASLQQVEWISFSRALHQRLSGLGLSSQYLQYAPDPTGFPQVSWDKGTRAYFWERMPADLDERAVRQILGCLGVELLEVRMLEDSQFSSEKKGEKEWAEKLWEKREDYLRLLAQFNIYLAPRRHEGIGMAYLEAMAMGMCVVAENQPTANEYILSGENGILYGGNEARLYAPRAVAVAKMKQMGRAARDTIAQIHQTWMARRVMISETVKRMSSMEFQRKSPPAEGLTLTLGFWKEQKNFWQRFETDLIGPWRSASVERKFKKETSLAGRIGNLWKHQRSRAHKMLSS